MTKQNLAKEIYDIVGNFSQWGFKKQKSTVEECWK